jgi:glycosyltransferase involved in cell wall biosynthesis
MLSYDILIPAYNAEGTLRTLLRQIGELEVQPGHIFLIDDGSTDHTAEIAKASGVLLFQMPVNRGKGFALRKGFGMFLNHSESVYLLCMDADLQHPVASVNDFLNMARTTHTSCIIGNRVRTAGTMPIHRILSNTITSFIISAMTGQSIRDSQCGYRLIKRDLLETVSPLLTEDGFQLESEFILRADAAGVQIDFVPIPTIYHGERSSINNAFDTLRFIRFIARNLMRS